MESVQGTYQAGAANHWKILADAQTIRCAKVGTKAAMTIKDIAAAVQRVESLLKRMTDSTQLTREHVR